MSRTVAVVWHGLFSIAAVLLYFFFVLPRWPELAGDTSHTLGTIMRIVAAALIGLAALPVVFTLLRTRRPEFGTPVLALRMRIWSIALHIVAAVLIAGTAISEIWLNLDDFGRWLFGVYGAAAAIALLGIAAFHLAFVAEMPPPAPKPLKSKVKAPQSKVPKSKGKTKGKVKLSKEGAGEDLADTADADADETADAADETAEEESTTVVASADDADVESADAEPADAEPADAETVDAEPADAESADAADVAPPDVEPAEPVDSDTAEEPQGKDTATAPAKDRRLVKESPATEPPRGGLRNRRPSGKGESTRRRRQRGGVAVED